MFCTCNRAIAYIYMSFETCWSNQLSHFSYEILAKFLQSWAVVENETMYDPDCSTPIANNKEFSAFFSCTAPRVLVHECI